MVCGMTNSLTAETCLGMPPGFQSPCGIIPVPHGPHTLDSAQRPADALDDDAAGVRARQVAAIHALANFYAEHPDVPMPQAVICTSWSYPGDGDEADRVLAVVDLGNRLGSPATETWDEVKVQHVLMQMHGMSVRITSTARLGPVRPRRYIAVPIHFYDFDAAATLCGIGDPDPADYTDADTSAVTCDTCRAKLAEINGG